MFGVVWRFTYVSLVSWLYLVTYAFARLAAFARHRDRELRRSAVRRIKGRTLRRLLAALGALFIKLGQVMSTRPDLFDREVIDELRLLQDRLPPFPFRHVERALSAEYDEPIEAIFAELDREPVAAASVAQVHRARLLDGSEVALKVLRPNVRRQVERDARILGWIARLLALHPQIRLSDPVGHVRHFLEGIVAQTHLRNEIEHYRLFRANFAKTPRIRFPLVHESLSSDDLIVMEFIHGTKIDALPPGDYSQLSATIRGAFLKMCFEDGFLHADLHPGNMVVTPEGDVGIFDVGLVKQLDDAILIQFIDFSRCITMGDVNDFVAHLKRFHQYLDDVDWQAVRDDIERFAGKYLRQRAAELEMSEFINELFALGRKHRVRPIPELVLILVGVVTAEGIGKMLSPELNTFKEIAAFLIPVLQRRGLLAAATSQPNV
ncbi:MAG: AarF/ABC1/UbiB kinase family protein [Myxococcales bacterium]|nr:AarF/ABC1/UbiB kinase family protein [Myxococcales bacterium]